MLPQVENRSQDCLLFPYADMHFPDHLHAHVELCIATHGTLRVRMDGDTLVVREGQMLVVFPDTLHGYEGTQENEGLMVLFSARLLPELAVNFSACAPTCPVIDWADEDIRYCVCRLQALCGDGAADVALVRALLHLLMVRALPALHVQEAGTPPVNDLLYQAISYISRHAAQKLTVRRVARALGTNEYYLSHLMNSKLHMGFRAYLNTLRVDRACRLLRASTQPIETIGTACGFESLRTFDRVFRQLCGCTPRDYRRRQHGG